MHLSLILPIQVKYDIVVASYSLEDVPTVKLRRMSIASLWRKTKQFLVRKLFSISFLSFLANDPSLILMSLYLQFYTYTKST